MSKKKSVFKFKLGDKVIVKFNSSYRYEARFKEKVREMRDVGEVTHCHRLERNNRGLNDRSYNVNFKKDVGGWNHWVNGAWEQGEWMRICESDLVSLELVGMITGHPMVIGEL